MQRVGELVGGLRQVGVGEFLAFTGFADPADRDLVTTAMQQVPVHGFVSDVQASAAGQAVQPAAGVIPAELRGSDRVVHQVRRRPPRRGLLVNGRAHRGLLDAQQPVARR
ncbi:hypothetical protein D9M68_934290 [compost metagenome]